MRFFSDFQRILSGYPAPAKLLAVFSVSCGGVIAYADSQSGEITSLQQNQKAMAKKRVLVLGTGWAGTSFLKDLDISSYDVQVVSPRNYFAFTPLLPSVTCGTVEARSIVEPVRNIIKKRKGEIKFWEAECLKIDTANKKVYCQSSVDANLAGNNDFSLEYDYLVVAIGAQVNTFNTPGVYEHCHFLKEVEDAQRIRRTVIDCFEKAVLPELNKEDQMTNLHFVIVGGGPTGVEFAAELHDFIHEDLLSIYPSVKDLVRISIIQSGDHILNMFDERISSFAELKFRRDGIEVLTGHRVLSVSERIINMKQVSTGENISIPHGMVVWSTGVGTRPVVKDFMEQIGQGNRRVLATDEWLRVKGCEDVYALGDCATVDQRKIMEDISVIFKAADKDSSGTLTIEEFKDVIEDIMIRYPQVELYLKNKHLFDVTDLMKDMNGSDKTEIDVESFKLALSQVDKQTKNLPATAQVASQQGAYLAKCFNTWEKCKSNPEGPRKFRSGGRHEFRPFQYEPQVLENPYGILSFFLTHMKSSSNNRYRHLGQFAPLGGEQAAAELPGDWVSIGHSTQWLWYSVYASKQVSWRTRFLVIGDWFRRFTFGRDSSRI
ncbi:external alternative NAD(P)H-ubiquinone oxidoreductase B1, mitochondrial-like isoform X1 [Andrographis paniculata]|uniref:external alternative NAD(P)H-ubiquinone oxidoreductase B1, mitochondrial-like isoform X1 n=1 Tax=Andrographis paniculata TaxID=175694 RepID=UPI0021E99D9B|nr:external alternative NAD(P)H-ubiquinone oxidoreductase B1, mitochondrial-like isoform X1 [Andrographis paniculata]